MARYLYSELANAIVARRNCKEKMERLNPNAVSASVTMETNEYHRTEEWFDKWDARIVELTREHLPSGSGFDNGTTIDLDASHADKLVFHTSFHHMHESGMYDGWTEHTVTVTPSFINNVNIRVSGRNRNDIKEYIDEMFWYALCVEITSGVL